MKEVWLIGAGNMAQDYINVLKSLNHYFTVIGRGEESANQCKEITKCDIKTGGLAKFLHTNPSVCSHAIVSVGVEKLFETTMELLYYNVKHILVEKPGALQKNEFEKLVQLSKEKNANVFIAYNRRFYASTLKAKEIIKEDDGVISFNFEFTEWSHVITDLKKSIDVKNKWFLANSTHVVDLAFFLGGKPEEICSFTSGTLSWHQAGSNFCGAGISQKGALFNYQANWESAGRWSVEILTKEHRLIFKPMEKLQIQKRGTVVQDFDKDIEYSLDEKFKPGIFLQTQKFLENNFIDLCTLEEQKDIFDIYSKMANYI